MQATICWPRRGSARRRTRTSATPGIVRSTCSTSSGRTFRPATFTNDETRPRGRGGRCRPGAVVAGEKAAVSRSRHQRPSEYPLATAALRTWTRPVTSCSIGSVIVTPGSGAPDRPAVVDLVVAVERDAAGLRRAVERMNLDAEALVERADRGRRQRRAGRDQLRERRRPAAGRRLRHEVLEHERHAGKDARAEAPRVGGQLMRHERIAQHDRACPAAAAASRGCRGRTQWDMGIVAICVSARRMPMAARSACRPRRAALRWRARLWECPSILTSASETRAGIAAAVQLAGRTEAHVSARRTIRSVSSRGSASTAASGRHSADAPNRSASAEELGQGHSRIGREEGRIDGPARQHKRHARRRVSSGRQHDAGAAHVDLIETRGVSLMCLPDVVRRPFEPGARSVNQNPAWLVSPNHLEACDELAHRPKASAEVAIYYLPCRFWIACRISRRCG